MFIGKTQINFFPTQKLLDITESYKEGDLPKLLSACCVDERDSYFTKDTQSEFAPFEPEHSTNVELHCILEAIIDSTLNVMPVINTGPLNGDGVVYCISMTVGEYGFVNRKLEPIDIIHRYAPKIIVRKNSTAHWFLNSLSESKGERYVNIGRTLNFIATNLAEEIYIYMSEITKHLMLDESKYDGDTLKFPKTDNLVSDNAFLHDMGLIDETDEFMEDDLEFDELNGITWKEGALLFDNYLSSDLPCALLITQGKQK